MGGGGKSESSAQSMPKWAEPYFKEIMSRGGEWAYGEAGDYPVFEGERISPFHQYESAAFQGAEDLYNRGDQFTPLAAAGLGSAYDALGRVQDVGSTYNKRGFDFGTYDPQFDFGKVASTYNPNTFDFGTYGGPRYGASEFDFGTVAPGYESQSFDFGKFTDEGVVDEYMSPYMKNVVAGEQASARREFERQGTRSDAERVASGSRGGYREALQQAIERPEQARAIAEIESRGLQSAYEDAGARYQADRQAAITAAGMGDQSALQAAQMRMRAGEGDRSAAIQAAQMGDQSRLQAAQMGLDIFGGDRAAAIQAAQMGEAGAVTGAQMRMRAGEGDRAAAQEAAQMNMSAYESNRQAAIRAAEMGDQSALQDAQMRMAAEMENAKNNMAVAQGYTGISSAWSDLGTSSLGRQMSILDQMQKAGATQRDMAQAELDMAREDQWRAFEWPREQLNWLMGLAAGIPTNPRAQVYSPGPDPFSTAAGAGLTLAGLTQ